jgi:filamentous hemagglutinin family protein
MSHCALANPNGPQVVNGTATFSQPNANTLNVTNSRNAIINWQSFSIGPGQTTNFIQPSSSSAVMNRVISNNPSKIYGNLNSNGKVFLINQHGMMIGAGARINTAGFYASTLNITNEDFLKGNLKFEGGGFGGIQNHGYIHAGPNGNVVLVAPDIENGGVIEVDNGNVILAAGESIRITSLNDAAIEFDVQSPDNGIINLGDIIARQGAARLFAGNLKHSGSINANGIVRNADGSISLVAQQDIEVSAGATLDADGDEGGEILVRSHHGDVVFAGEASARGETHHGGKIQILGQRVGLFGDAVVDVSGQTGGGEVLVGGDFQGKGDTQTAQQAQVGRNASIHADAIDSGDGGKIITWADDFTLFHGEASATGGAASGDGGFIEISGKQNLNFDGLVDTRAANGETGTVLFDPRNISVFSGSANTYTGIDDTFAENALVDVDFSNASIEAALNSSNVVLQANNNILWSGSLSPTGSNDLTLQAGQSVFIFDTQGILSTNGGNLTLIANSTLADGVVDAGRLAGAGNIVIGDNAQSATVQTAGGTLTMEIRDGAGITNAQAGTVIFDGFSSTNTGSGSLIVIAPDAAIGNDLVAGTASVTTGAASFSGNLNLYQGTFTSTGDVTVQGKTTWNPFSFSSLGDDFALLGSGLFFANGGFDLGSNLNNDTLTLDKFVVVGGTSIWNTSATATISGGGGILNNGDTFSVGTGQQIFDVVVTNNNLINKVVDSTGLLLFNSGLVTNPGSELQVEEVATVQVGVPMTLNQANLSGAGTFIGDVISVGGLIDIEESGGNQGTLTITGNVTLDADSTVVFDIGGPATSSLFDVLSISGNLQLGSATVIAFWEDQFAATDLVNPYVLITAGSITGGFGNEYMPAGTIGSVTSLTPTTYEFTANIGGNNIVFWDNEGLDELWATATNWVGDTVPGGGDFAVIQYDLSPINVVVTGSQDVAGLEAQQNLTIAAAAQLNISSFGTLVGDSLTINGDITTDGNVIMANDALWNSGTLGGTGKFTLHQFGVLDINGTTNLDTDFDSFGIIRGVGNVTIAPAAIFISDGKIQPAGDGGIGILTFDGDFINTGTIDIDIAGTGTAGTNYDLLAVTGDVNLQGFMSLNAIGGYTVSNDNFTPLTYTSISGNTMAFLSIGSETVTPDFTAPDLDINLFLAATTNWTGGGADDFWSNAANWDQGVPGASDSAVIGFGSSFNITIVAAANTGTLSLASDASITMTGGSLNIGSSALLDGNFSISGGTLTGNGAITANGNFNWTGGSIAGLGLLTTTALTTFNNAGALTLSRNWINTGTLTWQDGNISFNSNATLTNTGIFNANPANRSLILGSGTQFDNQATLNVNNGTTTTISSGGTFTNSGSIDVASATILSIATTAGVDTGSWSVDVAGAVEITGGTRTLAAGFSVTSTGGSLNVAGGTLDVNTAAALTLPVGLDVNVSAGTLTGTQSVIVDGSPGPAARSPARDC